MFNFYNSPNPVKAFFCNLKAYAFYNSISVFDTIISNNWKSSKAFTHYRVCHLQFIVFEKKPTLLKE